MPQTGIPTGSIPFPLSGCLLAVILALAPDAIAAQFPDDGACARGRVSRIVVESQPIFGPGPDSQPRMLRWARRLADFLHVDTRKDFITDELLFKTGDCLDPFLLEESERLLREHRFIASAEVTAVSGPDGTHVEVSTRDEWTTKIQVDVAVDDGVEFEGASVIEENFLGSGHLIAVFLRERKLRRDYGVTLESARLAGTRMDGRFSLGRTRAGRFTDAMLFYPFVGEVGRVAGRLRFQRRESLFPYVLGAGRDSTLRDYSYAVLPVFGEHFEATQALRFGEPGNLTLVGLGVSREVLRFQEFPGSVSLIRGRDFGALLDGEPAAAHLASQVRDHELTRLSLLVSRRKVRFETRRGLDAVSGAQNVPQGLDVALSIGPRVPVAEWLGRAARPAADSGEYISPALAGDVMARLSFFAGVASESTVLLVNAQTEGRRMRFDGEAGALWRDIFTETDLLAYWQPRVPVAGTLAARISLAGGWNTVTPFQLTLGGRDMVRGYREEDFPGGRRLVASLENRIDMRWPAPSRIDLGLTFFADTGKAWAGDVPFGADTGWKTAIGAGLRIGFPVGSARVMRVDLAHPVGAAPEGSGLMLRVSTGDFIGLVRGFADTQMTRSRRSGVSGNFNGVSN